MSDVLHAVKSCVKCNIDDRIGACSKYEGNISDVPSQWGQVTPLSRWRGVPPQVRMLPPNSTLHLIAS